jgi:hypothetical protein
VVTTSKTGSQAPSYFVETEYVTVKSKSTSENKEVEYQTALTETKKRSRLADFPDVWKIEVVDTKRVYDSKRHKWFKK